MAEVLIAVMLLFCSSSATSDIVVSPSCQQESFASHSESACIDINTALSNLTSNTELMLLEGTHLITEVIYVSHLFNIRIDGVAEGKVNISCSQFVGLSFYEVQNLTITDVVISSCGLSGHQWDYLNSEVNAFAPSVSINLTSEFAVVFIACHNLTAEKVSVRDTDGLGMLLINAMGFVLLSSVTFSGNDNGGFKVVYLDRKNNSDDGAHLEINGCSFHNNTKSHPQFEFHSQQLAGGGLAISLVQSTFSVGIEVSDTTFSSNEAVHGGGGVYLGTYAGLEQSSVHFTNCTFTHNCIGSSANLGGGLFMELGLVGPPTSVAQGSQVEVSIDSTRFNDNHAFDGGALYLLILQPATSSIITIQSSLFQANSGSRASGIATYHGDPHYHSAKFILASLKNCTIQDNFPGRIGSTLVTALSAQNGRLVLKGGNQFLNNQGSGLTCDRCEVHVFGDNTIAGNTATRGGGLYLRNGKLRLYDGSKLSLHNNTASAVGGAIYVSSDLDECFIDADFFANCTFTSNLGFHGLIDLHGNSAPVSSMIHGSSLRTCNWMVSNESNFYQHLYSACNNSQLISFDQEPVGFAHVSSKSVRLEVSYSEIDSIIPGQTLNVSVFSLDLFSHSIPDVIFVHHAGNQTISNPLAELFYLNGKDSTIVPLSIDGPENSTVEFEFMSTSSQASTTLTVELTTCFMWLKYNESEHKCRCDERLFKSSVPCGLDVFTVPAGLWFGPGTSGDLVWGHCPKYYCKEPAHYNITRQNSLFPCSSEYHRTGLLCGTCEANYSAVLGSSTHCKECSNISLFQLPILLVIGVLLIAALAFFHLSISEGYLNSMLFYSNILSIYGQYFVPAEEWSILFIFADFLSLKLNFNICLYDGMTKFVAVLVQYLFVAYIFLLMGIMYKIASRYSLPGSSTHYSPSKTAATLLLLCYMSLLDSSLQSLAFARVYNLDGNLVSTHWRGDTSLLYFTSIHGVLFGVAVVCILTILLPFTVVVIFPRYTYKVPCLAKLKPLYDALWAPFRPETRWWLGLRLIVRWVLSICSLTLEASKSVFALGLVLTSLLFVQTIVQPFVKVTGNRLDNSLVILLLFFVLGTNYSHWGTVTSFGPFGPFFLTYTIIITLLFYSGLVMIFGIHFHTQFPNYMSHLKKCASAVRNCCSKRRYTILLEDDKVEQEPTSTEITISGLREDSSPSQTELVTTTVSREPTNAAINISGLREDSNLSQAEFVTTTGQPVMDIVIMNSNTDDMPSQLASASDVVTDGFNSTSTMGDDRFHTCRDT